MNSLVQSAKEGNLPRHQYMDGPTLNWINHNRPQGYKKGVQYNFITSKLLETTRFYSPSENWFLEPKVINSIHGLRHIIRCLVYCQILCQRAGIKQTEQQEILIATSLHDCRRKHDKKDSKHGERACCWLSKNKPLIKQKWPSFPNLNHKKISYIIKNHEIPYEKFSNVDDFSKPLDILKTADALDRYRQPKLKWRIDEKYLRFLPTQKEKSFAYELITKTEKRHLFSKESSCSVVTKSLQDYV